MLYSVQNAFGHVYGIFSMPETDQSAEVWAAELGDELEGILGINGVKDSPLLHSQTGETEDRVVIDIEPTFNVEQEEARLSRVHETIAGLATQHSMKAD